MIAMASTTSSLSSTALNLDFNNPVPQALLDKIKIEERKTFTDCFTKCQGIIKQIKDIKTACLSPSQIDDLNGQLDFFNRKMQAIFSSATSSVLVTPPKSTTPKGKVEQLREQQDNLKKFSEALKNGEDSQKLQSMYYKISEEYRKKLLHYVWISQGAVKKFGAADKEADECWKTALCSKCNMKTESTIFEDFSLLYSCTHSFWNLDGDNIVDQLVYSIDRQIEDEGDKELLLKLSTLEEKMKSSADNSELLSLLKLLPQNMQDEMHAEVYFGSDDRETVPQWGKTTLENDVRRLLKLKKDQVSLIDCHIKQVQEIQKSKKEARDALQVKCFDRLVTNNIFNHRQLKAAYRQLSADVKAKVIKPPYFGHGIKHDLYNQFGAKATATGTEFTVYAPNAKSIKVVLLASGEVVNEEAVSKDYSGAWKDFRGKVVNEVALKSDDSGVWKVDVADVKPGQIYFYKIEGPDGTVKNKPDPFAKQTHCAKSCWHEVHESVVPVSNAYAWGDTEFMKKRAKEDQMKQPMIVYELHPSVWKKKDGRPLTYLELGDELKKYCLDMHYSHVELMAILDYHREASWGYQVVDFFAPNPKLGSVEDFKRMIDILHQAGIKVILDWVPAHFCWDEFGLGKFDGTPLFESENPELAVHPRWQTNIFDVSKRYVRDFLISSAVYWLKEMHIDALRVDAVSSMMLYDYDRGDCPRINHKNNEKTRMYNLEAFMFLRELNSIKKKEAPGGAMTIAEESIGYPMMTHPVNEKKHNIDYYGNVRGFGFDRRWDMGWMNDTIKFMHNDYPDRRLKYDAEKKKYEYDKMTHTIKDVSGDAKVVLPYSHDESSHGKKTMRSKMPGGDVWRHFADMRVLHGYQMTRPGAKLTFMGDEFGQSQEWSGRFDKSLLEPGAEGLPSVQWEELDPKINPSNIGYQQNLLEYFKSRNHFYLEHPALWKDDAGFKWINAADKDNVTFSYSRHDNEGHHLICVHNFSPDVINNYTLTLPSDLFDGKNMNSIKEVFNSDMLDFGGTGRQNYNIEIIREGKEVKLKFCLPPLAALVFEPTLS